MTFRVNIAKEELKTIFDIFCAVNRIISRHNQVILKCLQRKKIF